MTDKAWPAVLATAVVVGLATWHREFGEIIAGAALVLWLAFAIFCAVFHLKTRVTGESRPTARGLDLYGRWFVWMFVAPIPAFVAAWVIVTVLVR